MATRQAFRVVSVSKPLGFNLGKSMLLGGAFGTLAYYNYLKSTWDQSDKKLQYVQEQFENETSYELKDMELRQFPWLQDQSAWENKVVKVKGYLDENRFFVRRQQDGQEGYMVFAPMLTTMDYLPNSRQQANSRPVQNGLMVKLGWVPLDKKSEVSQEPPVEAYEFSDKDFNYKKMRATVLEKYEEELPMYEIKGVLKSGEEQNIWQRRVNWQKEGNYNWVDLDFMARLFRFSNPQAASLCYLEYVADEEQEDVYPKPATKETFRI